MLWVVWVNIRFFGCGSWRFRPYGEALFSDAEKVPKKACSYVRPSQARVPSLRDRSGRSGSGLLRCTSLRCVWLRQTVATLPHPDQSLRSAFRRRRWIKIKSPRANAHCVGAAEGCDLLLLPFCGRSPGLVGRVFLFFGLGGLWAGHALGGLGEYPFLRVRQLAVSPLRRGTFPDAEKVPEKACSYVRTSQARVPSLRDRSGRSGSGLLRCTSFRCVWLRQTVATLPHPDQSLRSAFRRRRWVKIKSTRACAHCVGAAEGCDLLLLPFCGSEPSREGGLTADLILGCTPSLGV